MQINWNDLQKVYENSRLAGVSFSLNYGEPDDSWYFVVSSAALSENFAGKSRSFDYAVNAVLEWLESLLTPRAVDKGLAGSAPKIELSK